MLYLTSLSQRTVVTDLILDCELNKSEKNQNKAGAEGKSMNSRSGRIGASTGVFYIQGECPNHLTVDHTLLHTLSYTLFTKCFEKLQFHPKAEQEIVSES